MAYHVYVQLYNPGGLAVLRDIACRWILLALESKHQPWRLWGMVAVLSCAELEFSSTLSTKWCTCLFLLSFACSWKWFVMFVVDPF